MCNHFATHLKLSHHWGSTILPLKKQRKTGKGLWGGWPLQSCCGKIGVPRTSYLPSFPRCQTMGFLSSSGSEEPVQASAYSYEALGKRRDKGKLEAEGKHENNDRGAPCDARPRGGRVTAVTPHLFIWFWKFKLLAWRFYVWLQESPSLTL